jgi:hypothetical protein
LDLVEVPARARAVVLAPVPVVGRAAVPVAVGREVADPATDRATAQAVVLVVGRAVSLPLRAPGPLEVLPLVQELS